MPALSPEQFVIALYSCCLGREPEPEGLAVWTGLIQQQGDPTVALAGIMASDEFRSRWDASTGGLERSIALATEAQHALGRTMRVVDVGAQLLGLDPTPMIRSRATRPLISSASIRLRSALRSG